MSKHLLPALSLATFACLVNGCAGPDRTVSRPAADNLRAVSNAIQSVKTRFAPDPHLNIFTVNVESAGGGLALTGDVDRAEVKAETVRAVASAGFKVSDHIAVLPDAELGNETWGVTCLSVANGREEDNHKAELGTQTLMGEVVRVWKRTGRWLLVQSADAYLSWMERGSLKLCTKEEADAWQHSPLLIVTALESLIQDQPRADGQPVSDVVLGCLVKKTGEEGEWFKVELPDGRSGYLAKNSATDYAAWRTSRRATPENIERAARQFLGRPYLWGANTPRGLDCSGFTKLVYFLNGIELNRNASQQALQGVEVPLDSDLAKLRKGDLLFFGFERGDERPGRVSHVGIYLGDKLFIQSSQLVRLSSLDPGSPIRDAMRIRGLLKARRVLPDN